MMNDSATYTVEWTNDKEKEREITKFYVGENYVGCSYFRVFEPPCPIVTKLTNHWWLFNVKIFSQYENRGYATRFLETALLDLYRIKQPDSVWLRVRCDNAPAIRVYHKLGFNIHSYFDDNYCMMFVGYVEDWSQYIMEN